MKLLFDLLISHLKPLSDFLADSETACIELQ